MKECYLEDENCEFERKETKENRTKSKIKEYFKKNDSLIKKNFNNILSINQNLILYNHLAKGIIF